MQLERGIWYDLGQGGVWLEPQAQATISGWSSLGCEPGRGREKEQEQGYHPECHPMPRRWSVLRNHMSTVFPECKGRKHTRRSTFKGGYNNVRRSVLIVHRKFFTRLLTPIILISIDIHQVSLGTPGICLLRRPGVQMPGSSRSCCGVFTPGISKFIRHLRRKYICQGRLLRTKCQTLALCCTRFGRDAQTRGSGPRWETGGHRRRGIEGGAGGIGGT